MEKLMIEGGKPLNGEITIAGAKNAALPILVATLLAHAPVTIANVPALEDVNTTLRLLKVLGVQLTTDESKNIAVHSTLIEKYVAPTELVQLMRASFLVLGPLLTRYHQAEISLPGGCAIGSRPVDQHLKGMRALGAEIETRNGIIHAKSAGRLQGADFRFDLVTVTGTENVMMAACMASGQTILRNAARDPEVLDLANFLNVLGAKITGAGTETITIEGVEKLGGGHFTVSPDRIEAGTYLIAAAMTRGHIKLNQINPDLMSAVLEKLRQAGAEIILDTQSIELRMRRRPLAVDITTNPYPEIPTDLQAQFMAMNCIAEGVSTITENIFENRFMHVPELQRMGAKITQDGKVAICHGVEKLIGTTVVATDLRASASLVLAGLVAEGETEVENIFHLDRGYEHLEKKLTLLGANIHRQTASPKLGI